MKRFGILLGLVVILISACSSQGMMGYPSGTPRGTTSTNGGYLGGMMGSYVGGTGMMGAYGGMMGGFDYIPTGNAVALTIDQAADQARKYLAAWGEASLSIAEIMEFSNHFYIEVAEKTGQYKAFELLMNKYTGAVFPEPGPDMMWNVKYGMMRSGMMAGYIGSAQTIATMTVPEARAREIAQEFLDAQGLGLKAESGSDMFYGYYTIHVEKDGAIVGMLGVNGYSGQVWYHNWHGTFIGIKEY